MVHTLRMSGNPLLWPICQSPIDLDEATNRRIDAEVAKRLSHMSTEQKIAQMIQAEISCITPEEVVDCPVGSILNGGGSAPNANKRALLDARVRCCHSCNDLALGDSPRGLLRYHRIKGQGDPRQARAIGLAEEVCSGRRVRANVAHIRAFDLIHQMLANVLRVVAYSFQRPRHPCGAE